MEKKQPLKIRPVSFFTKALYKAVFVQIQQ